jgi:hypothetical protein
MIDKITMPKTRRIQWSRLLIEKLIAPHLLTNFLLYMETGDSLTGPHFETYESIPHPPVLRLISKSLSLLHLGLFCSGFPI